MSGTPTRKFLARSALAFAIFSCIVAAWWLRQHGLFNPERFERVLTAHPFASVILFILIYAVSVLTLIPTLPLNLAAGVFWGAIPGGLAATAGSVLGTIAAFYAARQVLGQPLARRFNGPRVGRLQQELEAKGWRLIAFLRLNPALPTGPINYLLGLTSIDAFTYSWATAAFLLPPSLAVALIGHEMGSFVAKGAVADLVRMLVVVSAATVALTVMWYLARLLNQLRSKPQGQQR